ncbi:MAG: ROK family protein [Patescibacteria group bacterium]
MQKAAVGFDLGGSHCRAAVVDEQGKIIGETVWTPIDKTMSAEEIVASMADIITQAQLMAKGAGYEIVGCGGGAPGPMNMATGVILNTPNLVALRQFPLAEKTQPSYRSASLPKQRCQSDRPGRNIGWRRQRFCFGLRLHLGYWFWPRLGD